MNRQTLPARCRPFLVACLIFGCERDRPIQYPPPGPPPHLAGTAGQYAPAATPPAATGPHTPAPPPAASAPNPAAPAPTTPVVNDPITLVDMRFLRARALGVLQELLNALDPTQRQRAQGVPLLFDAGVGEVNAFAGCTGSGKAIMAISDGLLNIQAHLAQARACDERFGTNKVDEYIQLLAREQQPERPIVQPPAGFMSQAQATDSVKVRRQHELLDEQLAFVLGHELAHHHLGHLPCTAKGAVALAELNVALSDLVPGMNQPNELAADAAGMQNVLRAGAARTGYRWTEGGALLTLQFFSGLDRLTPSSILFGFERSHPPPALRVPIIQQTVNFYRLTSG